MPNSWYNSDSEKAGMLLGEEFANHFGHMLN